MSAAARIFVSYQAVTSSGRCCYYSNRITEVVVLVVILTEAKQVARLFYVKPQLRPEPNQSVSVQ